MLIDLSPLKKNLEFRKLYTGQFISAFGNRITYVAIPFQVYAITKSTLAVGLISFCQLVPLVLASLLGGALADMLDRRKLIFRTELALAVVCCLLALNAHAAKPSLTAIYVLAAIASALFGLHRPTLEAITSKIVTKDEIVASSALGSLRVNVTQILGPGIAGIIIAKYGVSTAFLADLATYLVSATAIYLMQPLERIQLTKKLGLAALLESLQYAKSRKDLLGTYFVDFIAMIFGMPMALFPAISQAYGGAKVVGWFYSAPAVGALIANITSGWTKHVHRHGKAIALAAIGWGIAIVFFGLVNDLYLALFFLALAGAADMVSVQFRFAIWRQTIPDTIRGRMASLEVISYATGPLMGDAEAGIVAKFLGIEFSVVSGGVLCILGVLACLWYLPEFWRYDAREH